MIKCCSTETSFSTIIIPKAKTLPNHLFNFSNPWAKSLTSLIADIRQDINKVSSYSRCLIWNISLRESPHRASSHSTDFSIVRFLKNIHSSHSTSINFSIVLFWAMFLYFILIVRISHSTVFWCSTLTVLWGDFLYGTITPIYHPL